MTKILLITILLGFFSCSSNPREGIDLTLSLPTKTSKVSLQTPKIKVQDNQETKKAKNIVLYLSPYIPSQEAALSFWQCLQDHQIDIAAFSANGAGAILSLGLANNWNKSKAEWFLRKHRKELQDKRKSITTITSLLPSKIEELEKIFILPILQSNGHVRSYYSGQIDQLLYLDFELVHGGGEKSLSTNFHLPEYLFDRISDRIIIIPTWSKQRVSGDFQFTKFTNETDRDDILIIPWDNGLSFYYNDKSRFKHYCKKAVKTLKSRLK